MPRYRVTVTLMGGIRIESKVFNADSEDAAIDMANKEDSPDGWTVEDEDWKGSDIDVQEEPA
jgi:hypothetical protein